MSPTLCCTLNMEADPDWFDASGADEEEENPLKADSN